MNKQEFITALRERIRILPKINIEEQLQFYDEMIEERIADGLTEQEAVEDVGSVEKICEQIIENIPFLTILGNKLKQKKYADKSKTTIIASTAIIWVPILIAIIASFFAIVIALYAVLWSLVISVWATFVSLAAAAPFGVIAGLLNVFSANISMGVFIIGCGIASSGLAIFSYYGALHSTKGALLLTKKTWCLIKKIFLGRW